MKEVFVPILYDRKALSSTQYASALQGIRNAASRYGQRLQMIAAEDMDSTDFNEIPDVAILLAISMPFIEKALDVLRRHARATVLAGIDSFKQRIHPFTHVREQEWIICKPWFRREELFAHLLSDPA